MILTDKIAAYEALLNRKEELAKLTKQNNIEIERARAELSDVMIDEEVDKISFGGYNYSLGEKVCYSKKAGYDEELFDTLREDGLGDIIRETVNPRTLQAQMRELAEHNDGELPPQYKEMISEYKYWDVSRRKST